MNDIKIEVNLSKLDVISKQISSTKRTFDYIDNLLGNAIYKTRNSGEDSGMLQDLKINISSLETIINDVGRQMKNELEKGLHNARQQNIR